MVDSPKDTQEDFVISNGYDEEEKEDLGREDYYSRPTEVLQNKSNLPYIIGGVGLVIIVILFVIVLSRPSDVVDREQLQSLEARIQGLEKRTATIGLMNQALERIDKSEKELGLIMERIDRFESTLTTQIDQIIKNWACCIRRRDHRLLPKPRHRNRLPRPTPKKRPSFMRSALVRPCIPSAAVMV